jgi:hypothetical protein
VVIPVVRLPHERQRLALDARGEGILVVAFSSNGLGKDAIVAGLASLFEQDGDAVDGSPHDGGYTVVGGRGLLPAEDDR